MNKWYVKWQIWFDSAGWYRFPVTLVLGVGLALLGVFAFLFLLGVVFVWPIQFLGWWTIVWWLAIVVMIVLEVQRAQRRDEAEEAAKEAVKAAQKAAERANRGY